MICVSLGRFIKLGMTAVAGLIAMSPSVAVGSDDDEVVDRFGLASWHGIPIAVVQQSQGSSAPMIDYGRIGDDQLMEDSKAFEAKAWEYRSEVGFAACIVLTDGAACLLRYFLMKLVPYITSGENAANLGPDFDLLGVKEPVGEWAA